MTEHDVQVVSEVVPEDTVEHLKSLFPTEQFLSRSNRIYRVCNADFELRENALFGFIERMRVVG